MKDDLKSALGVSEQIFSLLEFYQNRFSLSKSEDTQTHRALELMDSCSKPQLTLIGACGFHMSKKYATFTKVRLEREEKKEREKGGINFAC